MKFDGIGIYSTELRFGHPDEIAAAAQELEALEFTGLWLPGAFGGPVFDTVELILDATDRIPVATGIANIWAHTPEEMAQAYADLEKRHPDRFLLGLGASHAEFAAVLGVDDFTRPFSKMKGYLEALDHAAPPVPPARRALAALGPKMRELAVDRTAGIHSYFVTPEHTRLTREQAGPDALLAVEHAVVLEESPEVARDIARAYTRTYLTLPNYTRNLEKFGYTSDDFQNGGSDRLIDDVVAWGSPEQIRERLRAHLDAGAGHVCVQLLSPGWDAQKILTGNGVRQPLDGWRRLADVVAGIRP